MIDLCGNCRWSDVARELFNEYHPENVDMLYREVALSETEAEQKQRRREQMHRKAAEEMSNILPDHEIDE